MREANYDLVVFGATGFVGQLICRYLAKEQVDERPLRWAIAGRNEAKLNVITKDYPGQDIPIIIANSEDPEALASMCAQTKVVISTVGPYNRYGETLISQCAKSGTDYVDLCGEVLWLKEMIERYDDAAKQSGARICPSSGFDSVPSDLGLWWLQEQAHAIYSSYCNRVKLRVMSMRGGMSGGTFASMTDTAASAAADPAKRRGLLDPYYISKPSTSKRPRQDSHLRVSKDPQFEGWMGAFIMEAINSRIVHRSHSLAGFPYGEDFRYDEAMRGGQGPKGWLMAQAFCKAVTLGSLAGAIGPVRRFLHATIIPKPGQGPSPQALRDGFFNIELWGAVDEQRTLKIRVSAYEDPGYAATAKMLTQAALCLAFDRDKQEVPGGFWTPATALAGPYKERLVRYAGLKFERIDPAVADGPAEA